MTDEQTQFEPTENILDDVGSDSGGNNNDTRSHLDDDDLTGAKAWSTFAAFLNADELIDEIALAAREQPRRSGLRDPASRAAARSRPARPVFSRSMPAIRGRDHAVHRRPVCPRWPLIYAANT